MILSRERNFATVAKQRQADVERARVFSLMKRHEVRMVMIVVHHCVRTTP